MPRAAVLLLVLLVVLRLLKLLPRVIIMLLRCHGQPQGYRVPLLLLLLLLVLQTAAEVAAMHCAGTWKAAVLWQHGFRYPLKIRRSCSCPT